MNVNEIINKLKHEAQINPIGRNGNQVVVDKTLLTETYQQLEKFTINSSNKPLITNTTQARYFELALKNRCVDFDSFLELFEIWRSLSDFDKDNCIDKLSRSGEI